MDNPFNLGDKVITKFMGAEVEVSVTQIYNDEVQIRTADSVLRWRTMRTVWFPSPLASSTPLPPVELPQPVAESNSPAIPPSVEVESMEVIHTPPRELAIDLQPAEEKPIITTCGQEEAEELKRTRGKRMRRGKRRQG